MVREYTLLVVVRRSQVRMEVGSQGKRALAVSAEWVEIDVGEFALCS